VFAHLVSLVAFLFSISARSGELVSRLTADTGQIKSAVGASVSVVLRKSHAYFVGATHHDGDHESEAFPASCCWRSR